MARQLLLNISSPCHENWDTMNPSEKGKFCNSCQKQVIDFSNMSDREVASFFKKPSTGNICGRFMSDQLDRSIAIPRKRIPWVKYFFQIALPAFFISKASAQPGTIGTVAAISAKDSVQKPTNNNLLMGKPASPVCIRPVENMPDSAEPARNSQATAQIRGRVVDAHGDPVAFASIRAGISGPVTVADLHGNFTLFTKEEILQVSSAGFESRDITPGKTGEALLIQLDANIVLPEVVISTFGYVQCREIRGDVMMIAGGVSSYRIDTSQIIDDEIKRPAPGSDLKIFPNPARPGSGINIGINALDEGYYSWQLVSLSGQFLRQADLWIDSGARMLEIQLPFVSAGNYFLVLTNKKTGKKFSGKILIQ